MLWLGGRPQVALPLHDCRLVPVELVQNICHIPFTKLARVLSLELGVQQVNIVSLLLKLFRWVEAADRRVDPRPWSVVFAEVFVVPKIHLEIQLLSVGHAHILPSLNQVIELSTISSVVEIKVTPCLCALSGISSLQYLCKQTADPFITQRFVSVGGLHTFRLIGIVVVSDVDVSI